MNIRTWMLALVLAGVLAPAGAKECQQGGMEAVRAQAMADIHAENRASLERQLPQTQQAMRLQARESFLAQQPAPASSGSTAKSAP